MTATTDQLLLQIIDKVGELQGQMGEVRARLDSGQGKFDDIEQHLRDVLDPVVNKVRDWEKKVINWESHVTEAVIVIDKFNVMEPEFKKMKLVTGRFTTVALASGAIVGAALWLLGTIWPFVVTAVNSWVAQHVSWK